MIWCGSWSIGTRIKEEYTKGDLREKEGSREKKKGSKLREVNEEHKIKGRNKEKERRIYKSEEQRLQQDSLHFTNP